MDTETLLDDSDLLANVELLAIEPFLVTISPTGGDARTMHCMNLLEVYVNMRNTANALLEEIPSGEIISSPAGEQKNVWFMFLVDGKVSVQATAAPTRGDLKYQPSSFTLN